MGSIDHADNVYLLSLPAFALICPNVRCVAGRERLLGAAACDGTA